jgi:tetratricopeptide (TPR) repeat protein
MVEHRMYAPMIGLCWAGAALFASGPLRGRAGIVALIAAVTTLTLVTHARNRVWRDEVTLWSDVTAKAPRRERGWNDLALALEAAERRDEAERYYRRALELAPDYEYALVNLGRLVGQSGRLDEARALLERALRVNPNGPEALTNLGAVRLGQGDTVAAVLLWRHALEVAPAAPEPRRALERFAPPSTSARP